MLTVSCIICMFLLLNACESQPAHHISEYDVDNIGYFYDGLARFTINITPETVSDEMFVNEWEKKEFEKVYSRYPFQLCGYCDIEGNVIIEPKYDVPLVEFTEDLIRLDECIGFRNYRTVYLDRKGKIVYIPNEEYYSGDVHNGLFWVEEGDNLVYYNEKGKRAFGFKNATTAFSIDGGEISDFFNDGPYFSDLNGKHYAVITIDYCDRIIDNTGKVIEFNIDGIDPDDFEPDILMGNYAEINYDWYRLDFAKKTAVLIENEDCIEYGETDCIYDDNMNVVLDLTKIPEFADGTQFNWAISENNIVTVCMKKATGVYTSFVDLNGKVLMEPNKTISLFDSEFVSPDTTNECYIFYFVESDGLCLAQDRISSLYGYIDLKGNWVIEPQYKSALPFSDGYAVVNDTTVINRSGEIMFSANIPIEE